MFLKKELTLFNGAGFGLISTGVPAPSQPIFEAELVELKKS